MPEIDVEDRIDRTLGEINRQLARADSGSHKYVTWPQLIVVGCAIGASVVGGMWFVVESKLENAKQELHAGIVENLESVRDALESSLEQSFGYISEDFEVIEAELQGIQAILPADLVSVVDQLIEGSESHSEKIDVASQAIENLADKLPQPSDEVVGYTARVHPIYSKAEQYEEFANRVGDGFTVELGVSQTAGPSAGIMHQEAEQMADSLSGYARTTEDGTVFGSTTAQRLLQAMTAEALNLSSITLFPVTRGQVETSPELYPQFQNLLNTND